MCMRTAFLAAGLVAVSLGLACKKPQAVTYSDVTAEEAKRKAEEEAKRKTEADEARRKAEADEAKRRADAEEARLKREAEEAKRKAEAELDRKSLDKVLQDINFDYNEHGIREVDKPKLQAIADLLKRVPTLRLIIGGHCDERGTVEYNMTLGEKRASAARAYLVNLGVNADRLMPISYGKENPKVEGRDEASYQVNRRAEFRAR